MFAELKRTFHLSELADLLQIKIEKDAEFNSVTSDSRLARPGSLFLAIKGHKSDGNDFTQDAIKNGATCVINQNPEVVLSYLFSKPSSQLNCIAVTGTNGKTSVNWIIYEALKFLNKKAARIGTLGVSSNSINQQTSLTTPDIVSNYQYLNSFVEQGISHVVMEVSSHALVQGRVSGIDFDIAIFTNLTRDHFDYHQSFENYLEAKLLLFKNLVRSKKQNKLAVINTDDEYAEHFINVVKDTDVELKTYNQKLNYEIETNLIGGFHQYNLAAAIAVLEHMGFSSEKIIKALSAVPAIPGRLEPYQHQGIKIFIDYAHTPDAIKTALQAVRPYGENLWIVFGCGGDRDVGKRKEMAIAASKFADYLVVTSDNPRTEDPGKIISDITSHCNPKMIEVDRALAIKQCLEQASTGDVVLIAGKGHESYQEIGTERIPYSDQEVLKKL